MPDQHVIEPDSSLRLSSFFIAIIGCTEIF
jgi:hypothetical protein